MEDPMRRERHEARLASRKAEEAAWRRFQAMEWLDSLVGPLGISSQPTEGEFISCLRNGLVLCNAMNKIKPGSVPKVVEIQTPLTAALWDSQPLPAYQYFENVRNFLSAVEELKLPAFEASDLERDHVEVGSSAKVVDCVLALKAYHEWKQISGGNGLFKPPRSPMVLHSANRIQSRASGANRKLDISTTCDNQQHTNTETQKLEDAIANVICQYMVDTKENIDDELLAAIRDGRQDSSKLLSWIVTNCVDEEFQANFIELKSVSKDHHREKFFTGDSSSTPTENLSVTNIKCCKACWKKGNCNHLAIFQMQEKELTNLKQLLSMTKREFKVLQIQMQTDLKQIESQVQELSTAALGYYKVVKENRNLYNMVQDLKGNIRVYCRIRPAFSGEAKNVIDFIGEDGSLVISDPLKTLKDGRKLFQFNHVFAPTATQAEVFGNTQPLIRSVMDGYNVCIFAYGQTGSGKTHTMSGPTAGYDREKGINYYALDDLFQLSKARNDVVKYEIYVQMVEIYNEQVRDLLAEDSSSTRLEIRSCTSENGLSLPNATMHCVESTYDVLDLMKLGETNRAVSSTATNNRSSRSHSILTVHVHGKDVSGSTLRSCLHLVDLAGSERIDKSEVTGESLKEALHINKSLSCLGDVITALAQKNSHIPYRNSKLTLLLQNSLGGHAKTLMFAHVSPEADSFAETVSTLKFAQRVSTVELGAATMNKESSEVMELKEQVESLKKALANKETRSPYQKPLANNSHTPPPRPRRLSIENCGTIKMEKENSEIKGLKANQRTPPRPRRLSIENCNPIKIEKAVYPEKKGPKTPLPLQTRSRRLSLEGPKSILGDYLQNKFPIEAVDDVSTSQVQDAESASRPKLSVINSTPVKENFPSEQLTKTPEHSLINLNQTHFLTQDRVKNLKDATPGLIRSSNGKGSHIRKSLRTIGKLINGSEKRNQQKVAESPITMSGKVNNQEMRSPVSLNARTLRRQSLTGVIQASDRRSSLGGKSDSCTSKTRNSKTPPPVHPSAKVSTKGWL